jgi:transposase-like protein
VLKSHDGALPITVPRDWQRSFEPELIKITRLGSMGCKIDLNSEKIISL